MSRRTKRLKKVNGSQSMLVTYEIQGSLKQKVIFTVLPMLSQRRYGTSYQKELYTDDLLASDLSALKKLTRAKPELKQPIEEMLSTLNTLRNKAQTPLTSRLRKEYTKRTYRRTG